MAFIVENGLGVPGANAYIDVAFADAHFTERGQLADWGDSDEELAEMRGAIVRATEHIERLYGVRFRGSTSGTTQGLAWPRDNAFDDNGAELIRVDLEIDSVDFAEDTLTIEGHGVLDGEIVRVSSAGTLPGGLAADTDYLAIVGDADTLQLTDATGGTAIVLANAGTGTHTLSHGGVPVSVMRACAEYALRARTRTLEPDRADGSATSESRSIDGISYSKTYGTPGGGMPRYPAADRLIAGLLSVPQVMRA
jgi:hypothetical protein